MKDRGARSPVRMSPARRAAQAVAAKAAAQAAKQAADLALRTARQAAELALRTAKEAAEQALQTAQDVQRVDAERAALASAAREGPDALRRARLRAAYGRLARRAAKRARRDARLAAAHPGPGGSNGSRDLELHCVLCLDKWTAGFVCPYQHAACTECLRAFNDAKATGLFGAEETRAHCPRLPPCSLPPVVFFKVGTPVSRVGKTW